jgi:hypothetical protein
VARTNVDGQVRRSYRFGHPGNPDLPDSREANADPAAVTSELHTLATQLDEAGLTDAASQARSLR